MIEKEINRINKFLEGRTFKAGIRLFDVDDSNKFEIKYKFKIIGTKKLISVGEYYDFLILDLEIIDANDVIIELFAMLTKHTSDIKSFVEYFIRNYRVTMDINLSIYDDVLKYLTNETPHTRINDIRINDSFFEKIKHFQNTV